MHVQGSFHHALSAHTCPASRCAALLAFTSVRTCCLHRGLVHQQVDTAYGHSVAARGSCALQAAVMEKLGLSRSAAIQDVAQTCSELVHAFAQFAQSMHVCTLGASPQHPPSLYMAIWQHFDAPPAERSEQDDDAISPRREDFDGGIASRVRSKRAKPAKRVRCLCIFNSERCASISWLLHDCASTICLRLLASCRVKLQQTHQDTLEAALQLLQAQNPMPAICTAALRQCRAKAECRRPSNRGLALLQDPTALCSSLIPRMRVLQVYKVRCLPKPLMQPMQNMMRVCTCMACAP